MAHRAAADTTTDTENEDGLRALLTRQLMPLGLLVVVGYVLVRQVAAMDLRSVLAAAGDIGPGQWLVAVLATIGSFWAFGRFEWVMHRLGATGAPERYAQIAGIGAVGASQLTGFGLLTGTLARWRMFPDMTVWQATRLTVGVSVAFMLCLAVLAAAMLTVTPVLPGGWRALAAAGVLAALALFAMSLWRPRQLLHMRRALPPIRAQVRLMIYTAADTGFAALALYALLPKDALPAPDLFYAVFLLALFAGLFGTTPGGVGPFEYISLTFLPHLPAPELLAAIMGFRLVYFALPASVSLLILLAGPALRRREDIDRPRLDPVIAAHVPPVKAQALAYTARRAEAGLIRQGAFDLLCNAHHLPLSMVALTGQSLIMLSDPLRPGQDPAVALQALDRAAEDRLRVPCVYKCGGRTAAAARRLGWSVVPVSHEAWLDPRRFDLETSSRRQLRRQVRKAEKSGLTVVSDWGAALPLAEMRALAETRTKARGFSMGVFSAFYVAAQRCHLAYDGDRLVAFLTFHESHDEQTLDLVVHGADAPQGTMHLLVTRAIEAAAAEGCTRLSLAAVPRDWPLPRLLAQTFRSISGSDGLRRFKTSFGPSWETLYVAAPTPANLMLAAVDLADRITRPREAKTPR
ncbi:GNAT family N-acetyltransferase [Psychromarinibacter sp. S121]|uniref:GNAT family N-acetyltransferase n=1 Tax=Psychromarinibacter sp. S121 TaxID=3415127 RepID=UPI003C7D98C0